MSTFFSIDGFSTNDVSGAFAAAAVRDLHVNGHAFTGFPSVSITGGREGFEVTLVLGTLKSRALALTFQEGKKLGKDFRAKRDLGSEWMKKLQGMVVDLETAFGEQQRPRAKPQRLGTMGPEGA